MHTTCRIVIKNREGGKDEERLYISESEKERICGNADENAVSKTSSNFHATWSMRSQFPTSHATKLI